MSTGSGEVLTLQELGEYLKIPRSTLYNLVRKGQVPCRKVGRHWRFRRETIDAWLSQEISPPTEGVSSNNVGSQGNANNRRC
jgi:excisionase family DNA binding protein